MTLLRASNKEISLVYAKVQNVVDLIPAAIVIIVDEDLIN